MWLWISWTISYTAIGFSCKSILADAVIYICLGWFCVWISTTTVTKSISSFGESKVANTLSLWSRCKLWIGICCLAINLAIPITSHLEIVQTFTNYTSSTIESVYIQIIIKAFISFSCIYANNKSKCYKYRNYLFCFHGWWIN